MYLIGTARAVDEGIFWMIETVFGRLKVVHVPAVLEKYIP